MSRLARHDKWEGKPCLNAEGQSDVKDDAAELIRKMPIAPCYLQEREQAKTFQRLAQA